MVGERRGATMALVASTALFAVSYTLTKVALVDVGPMTLGLLRFAAAAVVLAGWLLVRDHRGPRRPGWGLVVGGLLGVTAYFALENIGVGWASASDAALLVAAYPMIGAALEAALFRRLPEPRLAAGILLAGVGVALSIFGAGGAEGLAGGGHRLAGDAVLLATGLVWAAYSLVSRRSMRTSDALVTVFWQDAVGAVGFVPLALAEAPGWRAPSAPWATGAAAVGLTLLCSIGAMVLYNVALAYLTPSAVINGLNLVPLWGVAIAGLVLHERVTLAQAVGGLVVVAGVALSTRSSKETSMTVPDSKIALVLREDLPPGVAANTAALLALSLGAAHPEVIGPDVADAAGGVHAGISTVPVPVLRASGEVIRRLVAAVGPGVRAVTFTETAAGCQTYDAYAAALAGVAPEELAHLGLGLLGPAKQVRSLTGALPLFR